MVRDRLVHIQPLLLTAFLGRPSISAGMPVRVAREGPAEVAPVKPTSRPSGRSERVSENEDGDTVAISTEADKKLVAELDDDAQRYVAKLAARDQQVRAHEQAHLAAAGPYATGGPSFQYTTGPDGKRYAIGGEVGIDTSPISGDPEATIRKAQVIRAAATAPADPSGQDQRVAAAAMKMETQARQELQQLQSQDPAAKTGDARSASQQNTGQPVPLVVASRATAAAPGSLFNAYA